MRPRFSPWSPAPRVQGLEAFIRTAAAVGSFCVQLLVCLKLFGAL